MYAIQAIPTFFATHSLSIFVGGAITMGLGFLRRSLALKILAAVGMILAGLAALWKWIQEKAPSTTENEAALVPFSKGDGNKLLQYTAQVVQATIDVAKPQRHDAIFVAIQLTDGNTPRTWVHKSLVNGDPFNWGPCISGKILSIINGRCYKTTKCSLEISVVNTVARATAMSVPLSKLTVFRSSISSASLENPTPSSLPQIANYTNASENTLTRAIAFNSDTIFKNIVTLLNHQGPGSWSVDPNTHKATLLT